MKMGLLWFDDDPGRDLAEKIGRAAQRYRQKFGTSPNTCYVHHTALSDNGKTARVGVIRVTVSPTVLLHHFWIGVEKCQKN
jgi:hypothetical protein